MRWWNPQTKTKTIMPKPIAEALKMLLTKAGIKEDDEQVVNELSAPDFARLTISDELISKIDNGLLSVEQAKNNHPDIKKHYFAAAYNGLDSELNGAMEELQISPELKNVLLNERSSTKRAALLAKEVKKLESQKKNTDDKGEKTNLQNEINDLRNKLRQEQEGIDKIKSDYESKIENIYTESEVDALLSSYPTVFDGMPPIARKAAIKSLINKTLQDKDAEFKRADGKLKLLRKDGSNVFGDDHRQWDPQILIDYTLSQNKVLKVTDPKPSGQPVNAGNNDTVIAGTNGNGADPAKKDHTLKSAVSQSLKDLENASKTTAVM
jgi:hypothetical protein